ncbi:hypothetical protein MLD52_21980 [Puniceicoccaceae bacterium K14]|nr:hypothetical protein [Puniceicoccaceae bacterium K14]
MKNKTVNILRVIAILVCLTSFTNGQQSNLQHRAVYADPEMVRTFILDAISDNVELNEFVDEIGFTESFPFSFSYYYPKEWPDMLTSQTQTRSFAKLGNWKIIFGPRERDGAKWSSRYAIRSIVRTKSVYSKKKTTKCMFAKQLWCLI